MYEGRTQELIESEILDNSEPYTNMEVTDPYHHRYDTVNVACLFDGGAHIKVVSLYNLVAPLWRQGRFIH